MYSIYILLILAIIIMALLFMYTNKTEHFNEQNGQLCLSCEGKNYGDCLKCFNCGYGFKTFPNGVVNGTCVVGNMHGPYNNEDFDRWDNIDPLSKLEYMNDHPKCSYGPPQQNRIIGI